MNLQVGIHNSFLPYKGIHSINLCSKSFHFHYWKETCKNFKKMTLLITEINNKRNYYFEFFQRLSHLPGSYWLLLMGLLFFSFFLHYKKAALRHSKKGKKRRSTFLLLKEYKKNPKGRVSCNFRLCANCKKQRRKK